tara:strand:- start:144 stop:515 length:372 start_codon:yes stop_codon:yes gene_type:complete
MTTTKAGFILALIGGIIGILTSLLFIISPFLVAPFFGAVDFDIFTLLPIILGVYLLVTSILVIVGGVWMRDENKCFKGGLMVLIFSIIGGGTILGIIGGIIGIVVSRRKEVYIAGEVQDKKYQ